MKGSCPKCGDIIDETEFTQFKGFCADCGKEEYRYYGRGLPLAKDWNKEEENED